MSKQTDQVEYAAARAIELAERFANAVAPNETIENYDHDETRNIFSNLPGLIKSSTHENLISNLNDVLSKVGLPDLEHETASRGTLVANLQGLEIVTSIQKLQSAARSAGYIDPDTPNLDLQSQVSQEFIGAVRSDLEEVRSLIENLDRKITKSGKSGISVSIGGVLSVDVNILIAMVRDKTEDALDYIDANRRVSAELLKSKLKDVSQTSQKIMEGIKQKMSLFGSRIVEISSRLARAAAQSYMSGLQLLKGNIEEAAVGQWQDPTASNDLAPSDDKSDGIGDTSKAREIIESLIAGYKSGKFGGGRQNLTGQLIAVRFIDSNSGRHAVLIIAGKVSGGSYRLTLPISKREYKYLSSLNNKTLDLAGYKAFEATKDNSQTL